MTRRLVAVALLATILASCAGSSDDTGANRTTAPGTTAPASTVSASSTTIVVPTYLTQPPRVRDDDITGATADLAHRCAVATAELMHFDVSWLTSSTPPDTIADVDPELLAVTQKECADAKASLAADLDPRAEIGWAIELDGVIQIVLDGVNATEVNLAPNSGLAGAIINIQGMIDGSFFGGRPGLVVTG